MTTSTPPPRITTDRFSILFPSQFAPPRCKPTIPFVLFAILLPAITLIIEWTSSICAQTLFDPLATPLHTVAVAAVPLLAAWVGWASPSRWKIFALGVIAAVSAFYALAFAPITHIAVMLSIAGIGLLALSPLLCLIVTSRALIRLRRTQPIHWLPLAAGLTIGFTILIAPEVPLFSTSLERACLGHKQTPLMWLAEVGFRSWTPRNDPRACEEVYRQSGKILQPGDGSQLSLKESALTTQIDPASATAYTEWTMEFANTGIRTGEARGVVQLPQGGVVSRATLWINGEEREAAFGGSSQVRKAYESVARLNRDPLLVLWKGPDAVEFRCAPVLAHGSMKIKLGVTSPLALTDNNHGRLAMPWLTESNFTTKAAKHRGSQPGPSSIASLVSPSHQIIQQSITTSNVTIVIDGSKWMRPHRREIELYATRNGYRLLLATKSGDGFVEKQPAALSFNDFNGGVENVLALRAAVRSRSASSTVVWIHGPQPFINSASAFTLPLGVKMFSYRVEPGANLLLDSFRRDVTPIPNTGSLPADLDLALAPVQRHIDYQQTAGFTNPSRLWAASRVLQLIEEGNREEAVNLATRYRLVTPVTGAVVLETSQQYVANSLKPPDHGTVATPEPATFILAGTAMVLLFIFRRFISPDARRPRHSPETPN